mmetsp:Transcript_27381/g.26440  ORF Transcript_27381/g.26440 Transcript_27381/m.26440 type:complete len:89 (+) Transcript_27381:668-934(+)
MFGFPFRKFLLPFFIFRLLRHHHGYFGMLQNVFLGDLVEASFLLKARCPVGARVTIHLFHNQVLLPERHHLLSALFSLKSLHFFLKGS